MRHTILVTGSALFLVAGMAMAEAAETAAAVDAGPVIQNSQAMEAADQPSLKKMSIRQQIQSQLSKDGYTDVTIMPSSFLIHAKDKQGNAVEMVIGPDSFTEVTDIMPKSAAAPDMAAPKTVTPAPKT
jgi:Skp family chaperone for outer membrane proteins